MSLSYSLDQYALTLDKQTVLSDNSNGHRFVLSLPKTGVRIYEHAEFVMEGKKAFARVSPQSATHSSDKYALRIIVPDIKNDADSYCAFSTLLQPVHTLFRTLNYEFPVPATPQGYFDFLEKTGGAAINSVGIDHHTDQVLYTVGGMVHEYIDQDKKKAQITGGVKSILSALGAGMLSLTAGCFVNPIFLLFVPIAVPIGYVGNMHTERSIERKQKERERDLCRDDILPVVAQLIEKDLKQISEAYQEYGMLEERIKNGERRIEALNSVGKVVAADVQKDYFTGYATLRKILEEEKKSTHVKKEDCARRITRTNERLQYTQLDLDSIIGNSCIKNALELSITNKSYEEIQMLARYIVLGEGDVENVARIFGEKKEVQKKVLPYASAEKPVVEDLLSVLGEWKDGISLTEIIGAGYNGTVYKALQRKEDGTAEVVAVKVLKKEQPEEISGKILALKHANIVPMREIKKDYAVMEFINGPTLAQVLSEARKSKKPLPILTSLDILVQLGEALAYAHEKGVLHRDIKPGNILLQEEGKVQLGDFGIATVLHPIMNTLTQTVLSEGTLDYMSPEQKEGKTLTPASDVYSLAAVAYELFTNQKKGESILPMTELNTAVDAKTYRFMAECLHPEPEKRPQTMAEFVRKLRALGLPEPFTLAPLPIKEKRPPIDVFLAQKKEATGKEPAQVITE